MDTGDAFTEEDEVNEATVKPDDDDDDKDDQDDQDYDDLDEEELIKLRSTSKYIFLVYILITFFCLKRFDIFAN